MPQLINKQRFNKLLLNWYKKKARQLPWRETTDPYKIWISEIMLQQTTVKAVIPYYTKWIKLFPKIKDVARSSQHKILNAWQGLGYYSRAKNIHKSAQIICKEYKGYIPQDPDLLKKLPGFGPYTIGAILSIAYHKPYPIIDANIRKVFMRLLAMPGQAKPFQDKKICPVLEKLIPVKSIHLYNQALMELGALVCRHKEPLCLQCPIREYCKAYHKNIQEIIPEVKKKSLKDITAVVGLIRKDKKIFIQQRPSSGLLADLWEFPGGKVKDRESFTHALSREIKEELAVDVIKADYFMKVRHYYTQFRVTLHVYYCQIKGTPIINEKCKWTRIKDLTQFPMPSGNAKIVENLLASCP